MCLVQYKVVIRSRCGDHGCVVGAILDLREDDIDSLRLPISLHAFAQVRVGCHPTNNDKVLSMISPRRIDRLLGENRDDARQE